MNAHTGLNTARLGGKQQKDTGRDQWTYTTPGKVSQVTLGNVPGHLSLANGHLTALQQPRFCGILISSTIVTTPPDVPKAPASGIPISQGSPDFPWLPCAWLARISTKAYDLRDKHDRLLAFNKTPANIHVKVSAVLQSCRLADDTQRCHHYWTCFRHLLSESLTFRTHKQTVGKQLGEPSALTVLKGPGVAPSSPPLIHRQGMTQLSQLQYRVHIHKQHLTTVGPLSYQKVLSLCILLLGFGQR